MREPAVKILQDLHGVAVTQVQDSALHLIEPHTTGLSSLIQPIQIPLQGTLVLQQINTPTQPCVIFKLTQGTLDPLVHDEDIKQDWTQNWGTPLVIGCQLDLSPFITTVWAGPSACNNAYHKPALKCDSRSVTPNEAVVFAENKNQPKMQQETAR
ncbi:hypothetical protein WISP_20344 [Willisornis vidua]|uniref:Uncharacterized protein n=1 Tax=Willisornis vidua TaxID=1566151 RepID=A0ABQ9DTJ4_9PASS|nr:hypothetical protein WISP_20344 [Willisornis vidua]